MFFLKWNWFNVLHLVIPGITYRTEGMICTGLGSPYTFNAVDDLVEDEGVTLNDWTPYAMQSVAASLNIMVS